MNGKRENLKTFLVNSYISYLYKGTDIVFLKICQGLGHF